MGLKYTTETFNQKLIEKGINDVRLVEEYKGNRERVEFECLKCGNKWFSTTNQILSGTKCRKCALKESGLKRRKTNEQFLKEFKEKGDCNIEILGEYNGIDTTIKVKCKINSNHQWGNSPWNLLKGQGCPFCKGIKILENDEHTIGKERPDLIKYFIDENDAFKYSSGSGKKLYFKCPECGKTKTTLMQISNLKNRGFSCEFCRDSISRPNKFLREIVKQLLVSKEIDEFQLEHSPEWIKIYKYRYDCYIKKDNLNILVEMDGRQHKDNIGVYSIGVKERDKIKNQLAKENNYILIRVNCQESNFIQLKKEILNSEFVSYISLNNINWDNVNIEMQKNLTKEICNKYNQQDNLSCKEIGEFFNVSFTTVIRALKEGNKLGWCNYNAKEYGNNIRKIKMGTSIDIYDINGNFINNFLSKNDACKWIRGRTGSCSSTSVSQCLNGKRSSYKNYIFKYHNPEDNPNKNNQK